MSANKIELNLDTRNDQQQVAALRRELEQTLAVARQLAATVSGGNASPEQTAQFRGAMTSIAGLQGAISAFEGSAAIGGPTGPNVAAQGARAAVASYQKLVGDAPIRVHELSIAAAQAVGSGVDPMKLAGAQVPNLAANIVAQAQAQQIASSATPLPYGARGTPGAQLQTVALAGGAAAIQGFSDYAQARTQQILAGGAIHPIEVGAMIGRGLGTVIGGALGSIAGPLGTAIGALGIGSAFEHVGRWLAAPYENTLNTMMAVQPILKLWPQFNRPYIPMGFAFRYESISEIVNRTLPDYLNTSPTNIAHTAATLSAGLMAGGINPFARADTGIVYSPGEEEWQRVRDEIRRGPASASRAIRGMAGGAIAAIKMATGTGVESIHEMYTRRLARIYGQLSPEMAKTIAPIFGSLPETGGNIADILDQFGPEATARFLRIQTEDLESPIPPEELLKRSAGIRSAARRATLAGFRIRGSGAAMMDAFEDQMEETAGLPGGRDSVTFARARSRMRDARSLMFHQEDITEYGIRATELAGMRDVLSALPFSPGNRFAIAGAVIQNERAQLARVSGRLERLRSQGELSEEEEMDMTAAIWRHRGNIAREIGALSEGMVDRLAPLSIGRIAGFRRFDSLQLAAANAAMMGLMTRRYGAAGGRHARFQEEAIREVIGDLATPSSRTQGFENSPALDRIVALLERLNHNMERTLGGGSSRMQRGPGYLPPGGGRPPGGSDAPFN